MLFNYNFLINFIFNAFQFLFTRWRIEKLRFGHGRCISIHISSTSLRETILMLLSSATYHNRETASHLLVTFHLLSLTEQIRLKIYHLVLHSVHNQNSEMKVHVLKLLWNYRCEKWIWHYQYCSILFNDCNEIVIFTVNGHTQKILLHNYVETRLTLTINYVNDIKKLETS